MIRLPHGIGMGRFSAVEQIKLVAVGSRALVGKRHKGGIDVLNDLADAVVARRLPSLFLCKGDPLPMNSPRIAQRGFDEFLAARESESFPDLELARLRGDSQRRRRSKTSSR